MQLDFHINETIRWQFLRFVVIVMRYCTKVMNVLLKVCEWGLCGDDSGLCSLRRAMTNQDHGKNLKTAAPEASDGHVTKSDA